MIGSLSYSQTILNGSFESDSAYNGFEMLNYLYTFNPSFYEVLNHIDFVYPIMQFPFDIDVHIDTNTYLNGQEIYLNSFVPDGHYALLLNSSLYPSDIEFKSAISMELSFPLLENHTYELSFYKRKQDVVSNPPAHGYYLPPKIKIGLTNNQYFLGDVIHIADEAESIYWVYDSFEFIAHFEAEFITIQALVEEVGLYTVQVDHFVLTHLSGPLPDLNNIEEHVDYTNTDSVIEDGRDSHALLISPNPSSGEFYLTLNSSIYAPQQIKVFNQLGQTVFETILTQTRTKVDVTHLQSGVYFLNGVTLEGETINEKFTIISE